MWRWRGRKPLRRLTRVKLPSSVMQTVKTRCRIAPSLARAPMTQVRIRVAVALSIALGSVSGVASTQRSANEQNSSGTIASRLMADGKEWTTTNLNVDVPRSYCYDDIEPNCRRYGRLYTWESAQRVCRSLGDGWRLPTDDEWRQMAKRYGGLSDDSADKGTDSGSAPFTTSARAGRLSIASRRARRRWRFPFAVSDSDC